MPTPFILDGPELKTPAEVAAQFILDNVPAFYEEMVTSNPDGTVTITGAP